VGYFLQAYLHFGRLVGGDEKWAEAKKFVMSVMSAHFAQVQVRTFYFFGCAYVKPFLAQPQFLFFPNSNLLYFVPKKGVMPFHNIPPKMRFQQL
jgi:hypothetical protein